MTFANEGVDKKSIKKVLIVTGEASGDLHGSNLVRAMRERNPNISFTGIGGDKMRKAGVKILVSSSDIAVVGLTEILSKIGTIIRAYLKIRAVIRKTHPDLVILIDNPGFNIRLARAAKVAGIPVFYYICPQLWAWGKSRVRKITQRVDRMAVILPFEKDFYDRMGKKTKVEYVGHPLMDSIPALRSRDEIRNSAGLRDEYPVIALVPGSRDHEIKNILPDMLGAAEILSRSYKNLKCVLPVASSISPDLVRSITDESPLDIVFFHDDIYSALGICDLAMVTSGTATLETAIMGVPMVIAYRISPLSYKIAKRVVNVTHVGLVNLVAGDEIVPELIQERLTPGALAEECLAILSNEIRRTEMTNRLDMVRQRLGRTGAAAGSAEIALKMLGY